MEFRLNISYTSIKKLRGFVGGLKMGSGLCACTVYTGHFPYSWANGNDCNTRRVMENDTVQLYT